MPSNSSGLPVLSEVTREVMSASTVDPVAPYTSAIPYSTKALAKPPMIRYLAADSCDGSSMRL